MTRTECQELVDAAILEFVEEVERWVAERGKTHSEAMEKVLSEMGLAKEKTK